MKLIFLSVITSCFIASLYAGAARQRVASAWTRWGKWSTCSKACGKGTQQRSRRCRLIECYTGKKTQSRSCNTARCKSSSKRGCGVQHTTGQQGRVVGGKPAAPGQWPWQVGLYADKTTKYPFCGGTLISKNVVITAAHCFKTSRPLMQVRVGDHHLADMGDQEMVVSAVKVIKHPEYVEKTKKHDIAILTLEGSLELKDEVFPACLPTKYRKMRECYVSGWGALKAGGWQPDVLQYARVPRVPNDMCNDAYKKVIKNRKQVIYNDMLCFGFSKGGVDTCQGDSGGPLVCKEGGRFVLRGVTSWGVGCASPEKYGVYTNVYKHMKWIKSEVNKI